MILLHRDSETVLFTHYMIRFFWFSALVGFLCSALATEKVVLPMELMVETETPTGGPGMENLPDEAGMELALGDFQQET